MLPCYHVTMLPSYHVTMLPCYHVTMLPCYHVTRQSYVNLRLRTVIWRIFLVDCYYLVVLFFWNLFSYVLESLNKIEAYKYLCNAYKVNLNYVMEYDEWSNIDINDIIWLCVFHISIPGALFTSIILISNISATFTIWNWFYFTRKNRTRNVYASLDATI